jgi:hypothetical protein
MDDWLIVARTESEARIATQIVMSVFAKLGFRVNLEKSVIEPTQVIGIGTCWSRVPSTRMLRLLALVTFLTTGSMAIGGGLRTPAHGT